MASLIRVFGSSVNDETSRLILGKDIERERVLIYVSYRDLRY
jgi:hypothetical protein